MAQKSSYLRYLPPVLWQDEPPDPELSLGSMLRIFEKILSGIDDGVEIRHGDHEHPPIEEVIARLHRLFDPWTTPPEFLDWLASWVSLEFPALWDEYQRRKVTSEIVGIYRRRGLKAGLDRYLDLHAVSEKRPRIAIDDCSKILVTRPERERFAPLTTLVSQGPLIAPLCLALGPDGSLVVGDSGTPGGSSQVVAQGVWRLPPPGRYEFAGAPPAPRRLGQAGWILEFPIALATDAATPWHLYVLDRVTFPTMPALYSLTAPGFTEAAPLASKGDLGTVWPVAMALDTNGHLLILDRGKPAPSGLAAVPKVIDVDLGSPLVPKESYLTAVVEPISLLVRSGGDLIIGDGREQDTAVPADLVRVDRSNAASWVESRLLASLSAAENPLVGPRAVVDGGDELYVLDVGLKPYRNGLDPALQADPFRRHIAEPAAIYSVDLAAAPPTVRRASETRQLVYPMGMALASGTLYVCDRGEYDPELAGPLTRVWRAGEHEFGVVVHFSEQRPTSIKERRQIVHNIHQIVQRESPAHTAWTFLYAV